MRTKDDGTQRWMMTTNPRECNTEVSKEECAETEGMDVSTETEWTTQKEVSDIVSMSEVSLSIMEDSSSSSAITSAESIEHSRIQADFAERTACEMKEWTNLWQRLADDPAQLLADTVLPKNSLAWEDEDDEKVEGSTAVRDGISPGVAAVRNWHVSKTRYSVEDINFLDATDSRFPAAVQCTPLSSSSTASVFSQSIADDSLSEKQGQLFGVVDLAAGTTYPDTPCGTIASTATSPFEACASSSVEDLHMVARRQREQVDDICRRLQWMDGCLENLKAGSEREGGTEVIESLTSDDEFDLPAFRNRDHVYLWLAWRARRLLDSSYLLFCHLLPLEWFQVWILFVWYTTPRTGSILFGIIFAFLAFKLPQLSPFIAQPPLSRIYPSVLGLLPATPFYDDVDERLTDLYI
jgi:hypothetical protein